MEAKRLYGDSLAILGGLDVDSLCRATPEEVRARTRETLAKCMPGGGYALGTGNGVANCVPVQNYLGSWMKDAKRGYTPEGFGNGFSGIVLGFIPGRRIGFFHTARKRRYG